MAITNNVSLVTDSLVMYFDAANLRSYTSGTTWTSLTNTSTANVSGVTYAGSGGTTHFSFSGSSAQITGVSTLQYSTGPRTIAAWVYPTSWANWNQIFGFGTASFATGLTISNTGKWATYQHDVNGYYGSDVTTNVWSHVAVTQSSSGWKIYLNGVLDNNGSEQLTATQGNAYIGASFQDSEKFIGRIAQVLFYNKELTANEIKQNYNATKRRYGK